MVNENPYPKEPDSGKETDTELEEDECLWEINPLVTNIDKLDLDLNTTANFEDEWFINEDLNLAYLSTFASDSVPSTLVLTWIVILGQQ